MKIVVYSGTGVSYESKTFKPSHGPTVARPYRAADKSGISQKAFCQLHDICLSTFSLWKRRLKQIDITPDQSSTSDTEWIEFPTHCDGAIPDKPLWDMELELPRGVILRMRR